MDSVNVALFGNDPKVQKAVGIASNVAVTKAPVLIVGEAGVGKRTLGNFIHSKSSRAAGMIEIVNCAAEGENIENAVLGHRDPETGRFVKGALEKANKGTVILANIESLDEKFQKRLYQIITELEDYDLDVRLIATTTKNLSKLVGAGRFYRGLFTYISANQINLTPLRERVGDLEMLANHFIQSESGDAGRDIEISPEAMNKIRSHYWTHNVLELESVIKSSIEGVEGGVLNENDLAIGEKKSMSLSVESDNDGIRLMSLKEAEKMLIKKALIHTSENRTQAAKILGVSIRTLRNKINEYRNGGSSYFVNLR